MDRDLFYYQTEVSFSYSDFDIYDHIFPKSILQVFQDIAGEHANYLNVGYKAFLSKNLIWVLTRLGYEVIKPIKPFRTYIAKTHPVRPKLLNIQRDFELIDKETGEVCVKGSSLWAILNIETRRLVRPTPDMGDIFTKDFEYFDEDKNMPLLKSISKDINAEEVSLVQKVIFPYLDHNLHMNNTNYSSLVLAVLDLQKDEYVSSIQINYEKECALNDSLYIYKENISDYNDGVRTVKVLGKKNEDEVSFISIVSVKKVDNEI